jgi:hypothetical protein
MRLFLPRWSGLAIALAAVLGACAARTRAATRAPRVVSAPPASAPLAPTRSASAPPAPAVACVFDKTDVALARPLTLLHDLSPPGCYRASLLMA